MKFLILFSYGIIKTKNYGNNFKCCKKTIHRTVVYFDQRMHAWVCVHMVENNEKR